MFEKYEKNNNKNLPIHQGKESDNISETYRTLEHLPPLQLRTWKL